MFKQIISVIFTSIIILPVYASFNVEPINLSSDKVNVHGYLLDVGSLSTEHIISYCLVEPIDTDFYYQISLEGVTWGNNLTSESLSVENASATLVTTGSKGDNTIKFLISPDDSSISTGTCLNLELKSLLNIPKSDAGTEFSIQATLTAAHIPEYTVNPSKTASLVKIINSCFNVTEIPQAECYALVELYNDTGGNDWVDGDKWNLINNPCSWTGVYCTDRYVTAIERANKNLTGSLPDLRALTKLQNLDLSGNKLTGNISKLYNSASLQQEFRNLINMNLANNQLDGEIPHIINNFTGLQIIELQNNQLTGNIPLTNAINKLEYLDLGYNKLTIAQADTDIYEFITSIDTDWENTQTIPPNNVKATAKSSTAIEITWEPIAYTSDTGYYQIKYSTISGVYDLKSETESKSDRSITISDLSPATKYYFTVKTITKSHSEQQNNLISTSTEEVTGLTLGIPMIEVLDADDNIVGDIFNLGEVALNDVISKTFTVKVTNDSSVNLFGLATGGIFTVEGEITSGITTLDQDESTAFNQFTTFSINVDTTNAGIFEEQVSFQYNNQIYSFSIIATVKPETTLPTQFFDPEPNSQLNIDSSELGNPSTTINILQNIEITDIFSDKGFSVNVDSDIITIQCNLTETGILESILEINYLVEEEVQKAQYPLVCKYTSSEKGPVIFVNPSPDATLVMDAKAGNSTTAYIKISNSGDKTLKINVTVDNEVFQVNDSTILVDDKAHTLQIQCTPAEEKKYTATLTITTNDPNQEQITYELICTGTKANEKGPIYSSDADDTLTMDSQVGNFVTSFIEISNIGDKVLEIEANIDSKLFQIDSSTILVDDKSHTLQIQCTPAEEKKYTATLTITTNDPNQEQITYELICTGTKASEKGPIYSSDFGDTLKMEAKVGSSATDSIKILNIGDKALEIKATIDNRVFRVDNSLISIDDKPYILEIRCTPKEEKEYTATLTITTNNSDQKQINYTVKCTAISDPIIVENFSVSGNIQTRIGMSGKDLIIDAPESFTLTGQIKPAPKHIEQLADIIVIYYWKAVNNESSLTIPITVHRQKRLLKNIEITLFEGSVINMVGRFEVEFGYRTNDGKEFIDEIATLEIKPNQPPTTINLSIKTDKNKLIGTLSTVDSDQGDSFVYSLINFNNYFKIQDNKLYVTDFMPQFKAVQIVSDTSFENTYPVKIQTTDSSGTYTQKEFIIQFVVAEKLPTIHLTKKSVSENYRGIVGKVWTDTPNHEFELLENEYFWLDDLDILRVKQPLDFETSSTHEITINDTSVFKIKVDNTIDATVHGKIYDKIDDFIKTTDLSEVKIQLIPDVEHWTKFAIEADILAVVIHEIEEQTNAFILNGDVWQKWDGLNLPPLTRLTLEKQHDLELFESAPFMDGKLQVYAGYRLDNGQLIYDPKPVIIEMVMQ
ncbi:fibronectin type III domain-containing protein [Thiotrichales bacterium HSG1]|nr:fibronectin type III domain-containing protein [Thiotrichales bacterium HSG1]